MSSPARELIRGTAIGRYTIEQRLGSGAMGDVYLGADASLGRKAAIKLLATQHLDKEDVRERFLREAKALASLSHPHLITVYEAGELEGRPYFAMELLEGGDTMQLLNEHRHLQGGVVARIGAQAALGLGEAARVGIIHRDVKPSNLGINGRGLVKVTDFGLAKWQVLGKSLTAKNFVVGTPDYVSPEQVQGLSLDERADVYSLGCSLFHLLTGRAPYWGDEDKPVANHMNVLRDHIQAPIPDVREYAPETDPELCALVRRTMAKGRDQRPTLKDLAAALEVIADRLGGELPRLSKVSMPVVVDIVDPESALALSPVPPPAAAPARNPGPQVARKPSMRVVPAAMLARAAEESDISSSDKSSNSLDSLNGPVAVPKWPWIVAGAIVAFAVGALIYVIKWGV